MIYSTQKQLNNAQSGPETNSEIKNLSHKTNLYQNSDLDPDSSNKVHAAFSSIKIALARSSCGVSVSCKWKGLASIKKDLDKLYIDIEIRNQHE